MEPLQHLSALQGCGLFADGLQGHMELALKDQLFVVFDDVSLHGHTSQNGNRNPVCVFGLVSCICAFTFQMMMMLRSSSLDCLTMLARSQEPPSAAADPGWVLLPNGTTVACCLDFKMWWLQEKNSPQGVEELIICTQQQNDQGYIEESTEILRRHC